MTGKYAALANTIKIEDITSKELNREILYKLKNNDESFDKIFIMGDSSGDDDDYIPDEGEDLGWLGYYISNNTNLLELQFYRTIENESFYKEISHNKSINKVFFYANNNRLDGNIFRMMSPFFKSNNNLNEIEVDECDLRVEDSRQLSLAIGGCNKSLKNIHISHSTMGIGQLVNIVTALSMHPQLETLELSWMDIGINECTALSTLLRCTTTQLQKLDLRGNNIDDDGSIEVLVHGLSNGNNILQELNLGYNRSITNTGWKAVATLLEIPGSKLETLNIANNNMGNDGALVFANALKYNSSLKTLLLSGSGITSEGWAPFSKLLCDISSVNKTYLSNHTLETIHGMPRGHDSDINANLGVNRGSSGDKEFIAMAKILHVHNHFNMQPFFEWEFKVLPLMIDWFEKADSFNYNIVEEKTKRMKLAAVYDFIKEFPMLYVEPMTRKEISEYIAMEEELQEQLKEIRQRKAHALRRL